LTGAFNEHEVNTYGDARAIGLGVKVFCKRGFSMRHSLLVIAGCVLISTAPAYAWNSFGHMEVAAVAKKEATRLLKKNPRYKTWTNGVAANQRDQIAFVKAATWPDEIKSLKGYITDGPNHGNTAPMTPQASQNVGYKDKFRHKYWHFIDEPFSTDGTPLKQPVPPNAQDRIALFRKALADADELDSVRSYDLSWLLHLVGDVHQPLHATSRFNSAEPKGDEGGNDVNISCALSCNSATELHAFWDGLLGRNDAPPQNAIKAAGELTAADSQLASKMDEKDWIKESLDLAKSDVYKDPPIGNGDGPFALTGKYQDDSLSIAKKQIALAGSRLANLLNDALK
jgi:hypothetical protein